MLDFLTNNFQIPATLVAELYRNRWSIELFFRWIKQHLYITRFYGTSANAVNMQIYDITRFYGTSANAVNMQIYVAIVAYCLVASVKVLYDFKGTTYDLFRILTF